MHAECSADRNWGRAIESSQKQRKKAHSQLTQRRVRERREDGWLQGVRVQRVRVAYREERGRCDGSSGSCE